MAVRYSRLSTEDMMESGVGQGGTAFDFTSPFTYSSGPMSTRNYKSAFTYSTDSKIQLENDVLFEAGGKTLLDKACYVILNAIIYVLFVVTFPISVWFAVKMVPNFERLVVFRWGQLYQTKGPGMVFVMPFVDRCHKVDIRMKAFTVPPQQVITGDRAIIEVGAEVYYRIANPELSITNVQNLDRSTRVLLQTSLLNMLVSLPLNRIEGQRNAVAQEVQEKCNKASEAWGIEICRLDISQIKILQKPPVNQPKPSVVMPPGLANFGNFGAAAQSLSGGSVPEAFQQLASAFMAAQGYTYPAESSQASKPVPTLVNPAPVAYDTTTTPTTNTSAASFSPSPAAGAAGGDAGPALAGVPVAPAVVSVQEIMHVAQGVLSEGLVRKVNAVYQFQLHGEGGGMYFVDLKHGSGSIGEGVWPGEEADVTLMMSVDDLQQMLCGNLKPFQAYMSGRLRVSGDLGTALRLETFVDKIVAQSKGR